ncbi:MAG: nuclear transport factor 2 family protein [Dehalococcoidia bacterium]|nr:nuclear transport factor 2 family protein [Dehalococcoidia bacterium]
MTQTAVNLQQIMERLEALEAEKAIQETFSKYSHAMDYGLLDSYANEVFTPDGIFEVGDTTGKVMHREEGTQQLIAYLASKKHPPEKYDKHLIAASKFDIKGDKAHVESFFVALKDKGNEPIIGSYGYYFDDLVKINGTWRIKKRKAVTEAVNRSK